MNSRLVSTGVFLALVLALPVALDAGTKLKVTTAKLERDFARTPLFFELRGLTVLPGVKIRDGDGKELPSQIERIANGVRLHWIAEALEKGKIYTWELELLTTATESKPKHQLVDVENGVSIRSGGKELTRYVYKDVEYKPYFYPVASPAGGDSITRHFPMKSGVEGERSDHPHHRSLWFTHGEVNGLDFWAEGNDPKRFGRIRHLAFDAEESGDVFARLASKSQWTDMAGKALLEERRDVRVYPLADGALLMDFDLTLVATDGPVEFGDTKEGSFGIRVAGTMKETSGGKIRTSRGVTAAGEAWGKPAEWLDYYGSVAGKTVGVAILDHPTSFRHPTHWHIRDYGLFAANPFGYRYFYQRDSSEEGKRLAASGKHTLEKGDSLHLRYRVYAHRGDTEAARVADVYGGFAETPTLELVR